MPGLRRSELLAHYLSGPELAAGDAWASGDPRHAQLEYVMHTSSTMARNGSLLTSCSDCHDAHGSPIAHDLVAASGDNALCTGCHGTDEFLAPRTHLTRVGDPHLGLEDGDIVCTACHMPPTARGGAMHAGLRDTSPATSVPVQYWVGDLATHRYRTSQFDVAASQPASVTQACAVCHALRLSNP
jgi:predicted CXXCH cytochrome family protein